ncbi:MAG: hypothetical protein H6Q81_2673 [Deltaproteobacteria bacterium]|nr:hypothetical protein [Deltaproteobacteria bacterium]
MRKEGCNGLLYASSVGAIWLIPLNRIAIRIR